MESRTGSVLVVVFVLDPAPPSSFLSIYPSPLASLPVFYVLRKNEAESNFSLLHTYPTYEEILNSSDYIFSSLTLNII